MKAEISDPWEEKLHANAAAFTYPATPDVRGPVRKRLTGSTTRRVSRNLRLAWVALILAFLCAGTLAVPGIRAQIAEFIQIGIVRIFPVAPTPTPTTPPPAANNILSPTASASPSSTPVPLTTLLDLAGETTLENARRETKFPIRLPSYPLDLGLPERVFLQTEDGQMLMLAWIDPARPNRVQLGLQMITPGDYIADKIQPKVILETTVNGQRAVWAEGPYIFQMQNGSFQARRIVEGNTLIWVEEDITYRLETGLSLEEAIKIAESLK